MAAGALTGRAALVTGGAGGIGSAVVRRLAAAGAGVCIGDVQPGEALAAEVAEAGGQALALRMDVTRRGDIDAAVAETQARYGRLDILVNVAGVSSHGPLERVTEEDFDHVVGINLRGVFFCCQAAIDPMRRQGYGRIVNIGSVLGKNGGNPRPWLDRTEQIHAGSAAYGAAKAGVHALTLFLAKELAADGITVNVVAPGPIATSMTAAFPEVLQAQIPAGRMGTPDDVAAAVAFLAGEESGWITGEVLDVNGGLWMD